MGGSLVRARVAALLLLAVSVPGCELTEVSLASLQDVVVAEALVIAPDDTLASPGTAWVLLHRTLGETGVSFPVPDAVVRITREDGRSATLSETDLEACVTISAESGEGTCYRALSIESGVIIRPGDLFTLTVDLPDGGQLRGATRVPESFRLTVPASQTCTLLPHETLEVTWTTSGGAWAYVSETAIIGLETLLTPLGIEVEDPLVLLGLSVSASDTTIVFPAELGLFDRAELDQELALILQRGLLLDTQAQVAVAAVDRNYVNWARGGSFNPSGLVRVPSVVGDGTGFFGSAVRRSFQIQVQPEPSTAAPLCAGDPT
jgi:hypothetical protein